MQDSRGHRCHTCVCVCLFVCFLHPFSVSVIFFCSHCQLICVFLLNKMKLWWYLNLISYILHTPSLFEDQRGQFWNNYSNFSPIISSACWKVEAEDKEVGGHIKILGHRQVKRRRIPSEAAAFWWTVVVVGAKPEGSFLDSSARWTFQNLLEWSELQPATQRLTQNWVFPQGGCEEGRDRDLEHLGTMTCTLHFTSLSSSSGNLVQQTAK